MDKISTSDWLVGETGVWVGAPHGTWRRQGSYPFAIQGIVRRATDLLVATGHGLWSAPQDPAERWTQLHDEMLTEVMAVALDKDGDTIAAGSYGICVSSDDELGLPRWRSLTETRSPDQRYTNTLCLDQTEEDTPWLAGTEAGVLVSDDRGGSWRSADLQGTPVRCIHRTATQWWAGTDDRGLWQSFDGYAWKTVETPFAAAFSVATDDDTLLVGSFDGVWRCGPEGVWVRSGPKALIRCLAVSGSTWAAGADPGGLWHSSDRGVSWQRSGPFLRVHALCSPLQEGGA